MCYLKFDGNDKVYERDRLRIDYKIRTPLPILDPNSDLHIKTGHLTDIKQIAAFVAITGESFIPYEIRDKRQKRFKQGLVVNSLNIGAVSGGAAINRKKIVPKVGAVFISAKLDGNPIQGWIGFTKFNEGDEVKVVVSPQPQHDEVYAILRPKDSIISIMPTCQQGYRATKRTVIYSYFGSMLVFFPLALFVAGMLSHDSLYHFIQSIGSVMSIFAVVGVLATLSVYKDFKNGIYYFSEKIFRTLEWKNPEKIDLYHMNKNIIKRLQQQKKYAKWSHSDKWIRPSPRYLRSSRDGFFYYDENLINNN